jgi:cell division septation protein DedD
MEELLGREVTEGKVIEGSIDVPVDYSEDLEIKPMGYRVQVMASSVRDEVEGVSEVVRGLFPFRVYIEQVEPFYKIRIGNFETREEANKVREELVGYGFEDAWIVETAIEME